MHQIESKSNGKNPGITRFLRPHFPLPIFLPFSINCVRKLLFSAFLLETLKNAKFLTEMHQIEFNPHL